ncbi:MAG: DUF4230 domain-containing protein [Tissierellia bacterium]|nr:DUF4230 domain-containing protein [Tissierellia bacterium]
MEKLEKAKRAIIGLILLVILVFASYFLGMRAGIFNKKADISSEVVKEQLQSVKELTTLKYNYTNVGFFENKNNFYGIDIPFTRKNFLITYDGEVSAGIDLDNANIGINKDKKYIEIILPKAEILNHSIDENSLTIYDEKSSVFNKLTLEDFSNFRIDQMEKVEKELLDKGFLEEAEKTSKEAIKEILNMNPTINEEYDVNIKQKNL